MSTRIDDRRVFSLREVAESIRRTIASRYTTSFWVRAEMIRLNHYQHSGHCYPDLVQKENGKVVAQLRAVLWANDFKRIDQIFAKTTGETLSDGIHILFRGSLSFDANYGLTVQIHDIDPVFSLGELEREKAATISQLKEEGLFSRNKIIQMPLLPKRLAVISVASSKGYADFIQLLTTKLHDYQPEHMLFPSLLQGEKAAVNIIGQLSKIEKIAHHFDLVVIVRGGGGDVGLAAYNNYDLARAVATFPIPVLTGIGHATNLTVTEMVAHTHAVTPSDLADIIAVKIIGFVHSIKAAADALARASRITVANRQVLSRHFDSLLNLSGRTLTYASQILSMTLSDFNRRAVSSIHQSFTDLNRERFRLQSNSSAILLNEKKEASYIEKRIKLSVPACLESGKHNLAGLEKNLDLLRPEAVLRRGYSLSFYHDKVLTDARLLVAGDTIKTQLANGTFIAEVKEINL